MLEKHSAILVLFIFSALLLMPSATLAANYSPQITAHRGASGYLPEHTLESKAMAYALGADYIEQDVVMSKDGKLMVMHDPPLETTTDVAKLFPERKRADGSFYSSDLTAAEMKRLRVTERFTPATGKPVFAGRFPDSAIDYRIPTLEEELLQVQGLNKATGRNVGVYVEVKEPEFYEKQGLPILQATINLLTSYGYNSPNSKAILQIFDYDAIKRARELGWKGPLAMLVTTNGQAYKNDKARHAWLTTPEGIADIAKYATIYAPNFNLMAVPKTDGSGYTVNDLADKAHKAGMQVHSWTHRVDALPKGFKSSDEMLDVAFKKLKLDGLFSDFPDKALDYLKQNKLR